MSSYTDYTEKNTQSNVNDEKKSTTSFGQPKNNILIFLAIALAIIVFIMIMCIIIVSFRRKFSRRRMDIGSITHLRNVDDEEYNSLDYYLNDYSNNYSNNYSNDYSDEKKRRFTKPRLPKANMADLSMKGNRNYKIYAKNNSTVHDEDDDDERDNIEVTINTVVETNSTSNNIKKLKGIKSLSDIMRSSKNKFLARNNTTGNFGLKSNNDSSLDLRISSPVTSVSTSIYNNERANSLADNSNSRIAPVVPPVPTIPSHKKLMEISRGSQMTTVSNDENNLYKTNHNTFTTINFSETNENITDNFIDNFSTTTNPYVISPKDYPAVSHSTSHSSKLKKNGKLQNMAIDSLYLLKRSNHSPYVPESLNNNKAKEKEVEKYYEPTQEEKYEEKEYEITNEDEDEDEENSNKVMVNEMILSRESNLYKKNLYRIT